MAEHFMSVVVEQDIDSSTDLILKCSCGWDKTFGDAAFPVASLEELSDAASSHIKDQQTRPGVSVRFYFDDADPVARCECGWHVHGDAAVDAFRAWWSHRADKHPGQ